MKRYYRLLLALLFVLSATSTALAISPKWDYRIGEAAPDFKLVTLDGKDVQLSDYRGKIVVLTFMTSWCPFCNAAAPYLEQLKKHYESKGVATLLVDVHEDKTPIANFVKKYGLSFPVALDADGKVTESYAPPTTIAPDLKREETMIASFLIIDRQGKVQFLSLNEDTAKFDAKLTKLKVRLDKLIATK